MSRRALVNLAALLALVCVSPARAIAQGFVQEPPPVSNISLLAVNGLAGGVVASTRALLSGKNPARAFALGTLGGMVHFAGKLTSVSQPNVALGLPLSAVGASMVNNAGAGARLFEEITLPLAFGRLRLRPYTRKIDASVNLFDAFIIGQMFAFDGLRFDGRRSLATGMPVFDAGDARMYNDGEEVGGVTYGPAFAMRDVYGLPQIARHEAVHVQQYWFVQETIGRPIEDYLRRTIPGARYIPRWLELGGVPALAYSVNAEKGVKRLTEAEAESLARP